MILSTPTLAHPRVEVVRVDTARQLLWFRWLDSEGNRVDEGVSVVAYTGPATPSEEEVRTAIAAGSS